jgi:integrase
MIRKECGVVTKEVIDCWKKHHVGIEQKTVSEAVAELIQHKVAMERSRIYVEELEWMLKKFADSFQCHVSLVSSESIRQWLADQNGGPKFKHHLRSALSVLFKYCRQKGYVNRDWAELDMIELPTVKAPETSVFTPSDVKAILDHSFPHAVPATAILAFAGLRPAEIERLDWADIGDQYITVNAGKAKTASRRTIPIQQNLAQWLRPYRGNVGRVWPRSHSWLNQAMRKAAKRGAVQWHRNALRHSFCSYRLAILDNAAKVALEAGNSPTQIFRHYRALVTPEAAVEWFNVQPNPKS